MTNPLKTISDVYEYNQISEFMQDDKVDRALEMLTKMLAGQDVNGNRVAKHIVECQALSAHFAIKAKYYMSIGKSEPDAAAKKNLYMTMKESFHELAAALKYVEKAGS